MNKIVQNYPFLATKLNMELINLIKLRTFREKQNQDLSALNIIDYISQRNYRYSKIN